MTIAARCRSAAPNNMPACRSPPTRSWPNALPLEAAEPLGIPVFPALPYGLTPYFTAFPGTVTLRVATYAAVLRDVLDSLKHAGFRRVLIVNGHGGNQPAAAIAQEWMMDNPDAHVRFHDWWRAPLTAAAVRAIDPVASHASWMENFPWTRLANRPPTGRHQADGRHRPPAHAAAVRSAHTAR